MVVQSQGGKKHLKDILVNTHVIDIVLNAVHLPTKTEIMFCPGCTVRPLMRGDDDSSSYRS